MKPKDEYVQLYDPNLRAVTASFEKVLGPLAAGFCAFGNSQSIQSSNGTLVAVEIALSGYTCACGGSKFDPLLSQGLDLLHPNLGCGVR